METNNFYSGLKNEKSVLISALKTITKKPSDLFGSESKAAANAFLRLLRSYCIFSSRGETINSFRNILILLIQRVHDKSL